MYNSIYKRLKKKGINMEIINKKINNKKAIYVKVYK